MSDPHVQQVEAGITSHLRASGEPVREAVLYERVCADGVEVSGQQFIAILLRLEAGGHVHMDPVHDERRDPDPFEPRFWRIID